MWAILNSLNAHNLPIFRPILMMLVSISMVHGALSDKIYLSLGLLSPLNRPLYEHKKRPSYMAVQSNLCHNWYAIETEEN